MKNSILKNLFPYLEKYKYLFLFLVFLSILGNAFTLIAPYLIGKVINNIENSIKINHSLSRENFIFLGKISFFLLITYISGALLSLIQNVKINKISQEIVFTMRENAFNKIHSLSLRSFNTLMQGDIITILINDIENISGSLSQIGTRIIVNIITIFTALFLMITISPKLTIIQLVLVTVSGYFLKILTKKSKQKRRVQQKCLGELNNYIDEILIGQSEVKSFGYEKEVIKQFERVNSNYSENATKSLFFSGFNFPTLNLINNIGYSLIIFVGAIFILQGKLSLGALSSFILYSRSFNRPIASISEAYNIIQTAIVSSERYFSFMGLEDDKDTGTLILNSEAIEGEIEFKNVDFSYCEKQVLKNLSFKAKSGKLIAIVGATGSGKTTIVNLLMRFFDISSGEIFLDGVNIEKYKKSDIRKLFGMVLQDTWLFNGTIEENIKYGNESIDREQVIESAKLASAHDFIEKLPNGYNTIITEDNMILSQGQKQLITIARIIAANPKFLILDEATSGVDTRTELKLQKAISNMLSGRTSFVIAHRLSTIKNANLILVLKDGKIVEQGTHNELLEKHSFYEELYNAQYRV